MFFHRPAVLKRPGGEFAEGGGFAVWLSRQHAEEWGMSTFDDPFDADRTLSRSGCVCGQHRSASEHDQAALALRCEPVPTEQERYEGVVASAVMRAMFPKDAARRAFLKSVGASTALAAISQFFPI
jgi:nitrate/nitrite transport system substrate-binding protein